MATTQNISLTAGTAHSEDFLYASATVNDKVLLTVFVNGNTFLENKSVNYYGSADEVGIGAGVKYTGKLTAAQTAKLPSTGVTYKLSKIVGETPTELFNGSITVASATETAATPVENLTLKSFLVEIDEDSNIHDLYLASGLPLATNMCYPFIKITGTESNSDVIDIGDGSDDDYYGSCEPDPDSSSLHNTLKSGYVSGQTITLKKNGGGAWDKPIKLRIYYYEIGLE